MKTLTDQRRLRISMLSTVNGELVSSHAADAWQEEDGTVSLSGAWSGLVPYSGEDHNLVAAAADASPLEWLRRRLATYPYIAVEIFD